MKRILIILLTINCLLFTIHCSAQLQGQAKIDSLLRELPRQKEDTNKVKLLNTLAALNKISNPEDGIKYGQLSITLATKLGWKNGMAKANQIMGLVYDIKSDYPKALEYDFKALRLHEEAGNKYGTAVDLLNIGMVYESLQDYDKSLDYYFKSLKLMEEEGDKPGIATVNSNIGIIYGNKNDVAKALAYQLKSLAIFEELGDTRGSAGVSSNIGRVYAMQQNYAEAITYFSKALEANEKSGNKDFAAINLSSIGSAYIDMATDKSSANIGRKAYDMKALLRKGIEYMEKSIAFNKEAGNLSALQNNYLNLAQADSFLGNYLGALESFKLYTFYKDSVFSAENNEMIMEQEIKYQYEKKEAVAKAVSEKEIQRQKLMRNGFMGGFAVVLLFAGIFFSQRNRIKAGKKQSDELLLNILPAEVAEELKAKGTAEAKLINEVTVLFTDFKGFTQLSEKLSPKELVGEINTCFSAFDNIMQKHGVEKIKTIGDAYMAAGGLPTPNKTHAEDVIKAALEIQDFMHRHKEEREAEGKLFFEIRIGVHTGPVVAGIVGIKKFAYDIWGDTVNTASRMESSGTVGKVNISETTYDLVKNKFICNYRGEVEAKGKGVMKMYYVG